MKQQQQELARDLYLNTDKTQQEIADILDVNRRTIYLWIRHGKWEEMKQAARQAPGIILQDIYDHITVINDTIRARDPEDRSPTMEEVEKLRKLLGMTANIKKKTTGMYLEAFEDLMFYISSVDRDLARTFSRQASDFVRGHLGDESFRMTKNRDATVARVRKNVARLEDEEAASFAGDARSPHAGKEDKNGIFCDKKEIFSKAAIIDNNGPESNTVNDPGTAGTPAEYPMEDFFADAILPAEQAQILQLMQLPLAERPSPLRIGASLWVSHIDDVEHRLNNFGQPWGEQKMADTIRRYPDVDPALKGSAALARFIRDINNPPA